MIPILDLKAQYESIKDEIKAAIAGVLRNNPLIKQKKPPARWAQAA